VKVERKRTVGEKTSTETAYYLSSLKVSAATMGKRIRAHWSIESAPQAHRMEVENELTNCATAA
jgi:predicted transposase YbfD/YdcC